MLSAKALEAVREAVESPTGPEADDFKAGEGRGRRQRSGGGRDSAASSGVPGRSQSKPRRRGGRAAAADERAARGEVGEYVPPGGSVELGMFGKKLVSFGQVTLVPCVCGLHGRGGV